MNVNTVYVLIDVTMKDRVKFMEYVEGHRQSFHQYGGNLLFWSNNMDLVEGSWQPKLFVVHEWPSEEVFKRWYHSVRICAVERIAKRCDGYEHGPGKEHVG